MHAGEAFPSWEDENLSTMKRAALWLVSEIGEGAVFTKEQLRDAFPGVSQIDRRMRDLRDYGWKISTNREDASLSAHEQRFAKRGIDVWVPGKAIKTEADALTATRRRQIMARDGYFCRSCGIAQGEAFAGSFETAQLDIARRKIVASGDSEEKIQMITECNRCRVGGHKLAADPAKTLVAIQGLGRLERRVLAGWIAADRRDFTAIEQLWADYRSLPEESRAEIREALEPDA